MQYIFRDTSSATVHTLLLLLFSSEKFPNSLQRATKGKADFSILFFFRYFADLDFKMWQLCTWPAQAGEIGEKRVESPCIERGVFHYCTPALPTKSPTDHCFGLCAISLSLFLSNRAFFHAIQISTEFPFSSLADFASFACSAGLFGAFACTFHLVSFFWHDTRVFAAVQFGCARFYKYNIEA